LQNVERFGIVERMSNTVTLSAKYQVVIPKKIREELQLCPGQKLTVRKSRDGGVRISTDSVAAELRGKFKGLWGRDSTAWLDKQRAEANRVRT